MDGGAMQEMDDELAIDVPTATSGLDLNDLVTFKSKGAHGDRGLVFFRYDDNRPEGNLLVMYIDGDIEYMDEADLTVADRSYLLPGVFVVSASDPGGQIGVITDVTTRLDLVQRGDSGNVVDPAAVVARGVSPAEVRHVRELCIGDFIVSGPWLGRVVEAPVNVDVRFDDSAVCRVTGPGEKLAIRPGGGWGRWVTNSSFYPGQRVLARRDHPSAFKSSRWLIGSWQRAHVEGTVVKVQMVGVLVYWIASAEHGTNLDLVQASAPPRWQENPRNLNYFSSSRECCWGLGDQCYFRSPRAESMADLTDDDGPMTKQELGADEESHRKQLMRKKFFKLSGRDRKRGKRKDAEIERPMTVADTHTTADVLWQDGSRQLGVPSASLVPLEVLNGNTFVPGQRVISRASMDDDGCMSAAASDADASRYGVVRSVDARDQTVRVSWFRNTADGGGQAEYDETVSAYDLDFVDYDQDIFYGNIVVRRQQPLLSNKDTAVDKLSWLGHAIDLCDDGRVEVKWGDGTTTKVSLSIYPRCIFFLKGLNFFF